MGRTQSVYALSPNRIWTQGEHNRLRLSPPTSPNVLQVLSRVGGRLENLMKQIRRGYWLEPKWPHDCVVSFSLRFQGTCLFPPEPERYLYAI